MEGCAAPCAAADEDREEQEKSAKDAAENDDEDYTIAECHACSGVRAGLLQTATILPQEACRSC